MIELLKKEKIAFRQCSENIKRKDRVTVRFFQLKYKIGKFHVESFRKCIVSELYLPLKCQFKKKLKNKQY